MSLQVLLIEHEDVGGLYPFSQLHCSWELRTGAFTILERWQKSLPNASVTVSTHRVLHLRSFVERYPKTDHFLSRPTMIIAGHLVTSPLVMRQMAETCATSTEPILFYCSGQAVGAFVPHEMSSPEEARINIDMLDADVCRTIEISGHTLNRLWQTLDLIKPCINWDSELLQHHVDDEAVVHPTTVIDTSGGPVLILEGAHVGPLSVIVGPTVIGESSTVNAHAHIKSSVIGPRCKVGGEISESIFQGFANKQHDGFLGNSFIGEWANLGAGTTTSNLKNTYGHVRVSLPWLEEDTQRMFLGLLMGDHSKSGIGSRFDTGSVCGTSSNIVANLIAPRQIGSFRWLTPTTSEPYILDKALKVMKAVMARRMREMGPSEEELIKEVERKTHG